MSEFLVYTIVCHRVLLLILPFCSRSCCQFIVQLPQFHGQRIRSWSCRRFCRYLGFDVLLHRWKQSLEPAQVSELVCIVLQKLGLLQLLSLGIESLLICFVDSDYALFVHILEQRDDIVLLLDGGVEQIEGVMDEVPLDFGV